MTIPKTIFKMNKQELICYNTDASRRIGIAKKVIFPTNIETIQKIISSTKGDIIPRGSGSNIVGACIPNDSTVLDMKKMNKATDFDPNKNTITVKSGATIKELNEKLKSVGYEFPIFSNEISTIGGMIAMNTLADFGGYGNIKDWIEELELINGRGEIVKITKTDISDVCGMEGTTGVITKAILKIIPIINRSASILQTESIEEIRLFAKRLRLEKEVAMLRFYSPSFSKLINLSEKYNLIIIFNSDRGKIKGEEYRDLLKKIKKDYFTLYSKGYNDSEDPIFPHDKLKEFISFLDSNDIPYYGDFCSNIIYPYFKDNKKTEEVDKMIQRLSGIPGKYGIGSTRKELLDTLRKKILLRVKLRYDPFWKLNNGKLIDFVEKSEVEVEEKESILSPLKEKETPESKMNEFIRKIDESNEEPHNKDNDTEVEEQVKKEIKDYKETFDPLVKKQVEEIEKFAREIPKDLTDREEEIGKVKTTDNLERPTKTSNDVDGEKSLIDKIMFNKGDEDENRRT